MCGLSDPLNCQILGRIKALRALRKYLGDCLYLCMCVCYSGDAHKVIQR